MSTGTPQQSTGSQFQVILDGLKLDSAVEGRIEQEIRSLVMRELAALDLKGDLVLHPRSVATQKLAAFALFPGGSTRGLVADLS